MAYWIIAILGIVCLYPAWEDFKQKKYVRGIVWAIVALFLFVGGAGSAMDGSSSSSSSSTESSSSKSSETASSKKQESTDKKHKKQAQKGVDDINNKIAQEPDLDGLKVSLDKYDTSGQDYDVQVPDSALGGSDAQLRSICKNVFTIIAHETGNQNPTVTYYDESGNQIAETKWDGSIKLDN